MSKQLQELNEELARISKAVAEARIAAIRSEVKATCTAKRLNGGGL